MSNRTGSSFGATDVRAYITNNRLPVFDFNTEQIKLDLSNNVVPILKGISQDLDNFDATFDLSINGSTLWADSTPAPKPFFADPNGREGWYYDNFSNIANVSNIYWYANPVSGSLQENDMTFSQLSGMYCIITSDYVDNASLTIPIMNVYSQPTGTNDFIPGFAHSRWAYSLNATNRAKLRKAETIILYTSLTRPQVYLNLPAYKLDLASQNGDASQSEIVAYLTVNTQATTSKIGYLLQYAGYLNSAIGFNREYKFSNGKDRIIQNNLSSGFFGLTGSVSISPGTLVGITGLAGVTGSVSISNFPTLQGVTGQVSLAPGTLLGITGLAGVTGSIEISNFPTLQGVTGQVSLAPGTLVGVTGLAGVTGSVEISNFPTLQGVSGQVSLAPGTLVGVTGLAGVTGSIEISNFPTLQGVTGQVSLAPGTLLGITGLAGVTGSIEISNFPTLQGVTGQVSLAPGTLVGVTGLAGITGSIEISNFPTLQGVTGQVSLSSNTLVGITGLAGVTGSVEISNFPTLQGVTGHVSLAPGTLVGVTGLAGVTGSIEISNFPTLQGVTGQVSLAPGTLVGITGLAGVTGSVSISNFPTLQGVTGQVSLAPNSYVGITGLVGVTGDFNLTVGAVEISGSVMTHDTSANAKLTTIETDISSGILVKGQDDTGTRYPFYVDDNGIQRTQIVEGRIQTAKYVFSTDATVITSNSGANWSLDPRGRRPGWYYNNVSNVSLNWYSNTISAPPSIEFNKMQSVWMIITPDYVADLPKFRVITTSSVWEYTYSTAIVPAVYNGETYMFYFGAKAINLHPSVTPRLMTRTLISGAGANNENITAINIFTNLNVGTLYQSAGIYDQTNAQQFETIFSDNNDYTEQQNLLKLTFDASLNLKTSVNNLPANPVYTTLTGTNLVGVTGLAGVTGNVGINAGSFVGITGIAGITGQVSLATGSAVGITQGSNTATVSGYFGVLNSQQNLPSLYTSSALYAHEPTNGTTDTVTYTSVTIGATAHRSIDTYITGVNGNVGITGAISILPNQTVNSVLRAKDVFNTAFNDLTATSTTSSSAFYNGLDVFVKNGSTTVDRTIFGATGATAGINTNTGINTYSIPIKQKQLVMSGTTATANGVLAGGGNTFTISSADWGITKPKTFSIFMTTGSAVKTFYYDYVDVCGNERTGTYAVPAVNTWYTLPLQTGFTEQMVGINNVRVSASLLANDVYYIAYNASIATAVASGTVGRNFNGIITIPNNAIGYVSNVMMFNAVASNWNLHKYDAVTGARKNIYYYNTAFAINHASSGYEGALGGILQPGEAILCANENANSMVTFVNVVIKYLS